MSFENTSSRDCSLTPRGPSAMNLRRKITFAFIPLIGIYVVVKR